MTTQSVALRRVVRIVNGGTPGPEPENWNGEVPWATPVDLGRANGLSLSETGRNLTTKGAISGSAIAPKGSVLLSTRAPIGYAAINNVPMAFNQGCKALIPADGVSARFLRYALTHIEPRLQSMGQGSTFLELSASALASVEIPLPATNVQIRTVDFLDRETAQIDDLIGKQERLIDLLAEKRQAVVSDYIADMIQPIPRDLGMRLKHLYDVIDERANGADFPLMSVSIHRGLQRREETTDDEPRADDLSNYKVCRAGDIVINRMRAFQGALGYSAESGLISPDYLVLRPHRTVDSGWLSAVLRSHWAIGQMRARLRGIGSVEQGVVRTPRINASDLGEIRIRVPSATAQRSFLEHNQDVTERLDFLANKAAAAVGLLRERRSALISAAVTGKMDVREGVA